MSRDIVPKLSTKEKEQLRNKGYKFHVEHELPKILIPWSRQSWIFTAGITGVLFALRTFAKRNGHTYFLYSAGIIAAVGMQALLFTKIDNKTSSKNHRLTLNQVPVNLVAAHALRDVVSEAKDEISQLKYLVKNLSQEVKRRHLE